MRPLINRMVFAGFMVAASCAEASVPGWVRDLAKVPINLSSYDDETNAVVLLDDTTASLQQNGDIILSRRRVLRILRQQGSGHAKLTIPFDKDQKITSLHAYSINAKGMEMEAKEKDAVEQSIVEGSLYEDTKYKVITAPEGDAGSVVAFEYDQRQRPYLLELVWHFQEREPVLLSRFTLNLPAGWEYSEKWLHQVAVKPLKQSGQQTVWEMRDVSGVKHEYRMPSWNAVARRMSVHVFGAGMQGKSNRTWAEFGSWYSDLAKSRRDTTPQITSTVHDLTATTPDLEGKLSAIAGWMQHQIRYVSIQIGIGGFQPHAAGDIFRNRYGDCKDKATLMSTMLKEAGLESTYVIVNAIDRSAVNPEAPSTGYFNHAIVAIRLPGQEFKGAPAAFADKEGRRWLLFDPTDEHLPIGHIEGSMQGSYALLVTSPGGELVRIPLANPENNYFNRSGKLTLAPDGSLSGEIIETSFGDNADGFRAIANTLPPTQMRKALEHRMNEAFAGASLDDIQIENLDRYDQELRVKYKFKANSYAKTAGPLLLVRPRVLGRFSDMLESKPREYAYEFDYVEGRKDEFEITLPPGFQADELPKPVKSEFAFATYNASTDLKDNVLRYKRTYEIRNPEVSLDQISDLGRLFHAITQDEKNSAILKKAE